MYCTNCGTEVQPDAKFCRQCGSSVRDEANPPNFQPRMREGGSRGNALPGASSSSRTASQRESQAEATIETTYEEDIEELYEDDGEGDGPWHLFQRLTRLQQATIAGIAAAVVISVALALDLGGAVIAIIVVLVVVLAAARYASGSSLAPAVIDDDVFIWQYRSESDFRRDAARLSRQGFAVVSVVDQQQRAGCLRILLLGFVALLWRPPARLLVTYQRRGW